MSDPTTKPPRHRCAGCRLALTKFTRWRDATDTYRPCAWCDRCVAQYQQEHPRGRQTPQRAPPWEVAKRALKV